MANMEPSTEITTQAEEYLEAVSRISDRGTQVTPTELSRELKVTPTSVLGMLHRMEEQGLSTYSRQTGVILTEHGRACAETIRRRHRLAERLLTDILNVPWERVHDIACRFEHVIDDELEPYLVRVLRNPTTCPHGNSLLIEGETTLALLHPLNTLEAGQTAAVVRIVDESTPLLTYLGELGICPGVTVKVINIAPFAGPLMIEIGEAQHALAREVAEHVLVR